MAPKSKRSGGNGKAAKKASKKTKSSGASQMEEARSDPSVFMGEGQSATLGVLPKELKIAIFRFLDPVRSTCLGLTCKDLWKIHREFHQEVLINTTIHTAGEPPQKLAILLTNWMGPDMVWNAIKFLHKDIVAAQVEDLNERVRKAKEDREKAQRLRKQLNGSFSLD